MKKNILTLLLALLISFTLVFVLPRLAFYQDATKGGGLAGGLMIPFVTLIVVPLIFAVVGSQSSREHPVRQGWYSFGISFFAAVLALMILGSSRIDEVRDAIRIECEEALERNRLYRLDHPDYTLVAPPCD